MSLKEIMQQALSPANFKEIRTNGYYTALPVTLNSLSMGGVLPVVLYMMRWGHRRGKGKFADVYAPGGKGRATIEDVARKLAERKDWFEGFDDGTPTAILGDLLLAYCLENRLHQPGRDKQVQRVYPAHYYSSWVDLPDIVANLRYVPELITALLSSGNKRSHYPRPGGFTDNLLLQLFGEGMSIEGQRDNLASDYFDEATEVGLDQLLAIRLGQSLKEAPLKLSGENPAMPDQRPVAQVACRRLFEDLNVFLRAYARQMPRQSFLPMLESCLSIGMTTIFLSTMQILREWERTQCVPEMKDQIPWPLFVDCSVSTDRDLQRYSEECMDDLMRSLARLPVTMACLRALDLAARRSNLKDIPPGSPDPTERINYLGSLLDDDSRDALKVETWLEDVCNQLSEQLFEGSAPGKPQENDPQVQTALEELRLLQDSAIHPARRLAEAIVIMMSDSLDFVHYRKFLDGCLMTDEPNGLCKRRRTSTRGIRNAERRSITLTNSALDFLVHRHLCKDGKGLSQRQISLSDFIQTLRERYGFYIDQAPSNLPVPVEVLQRNRRHLERRLRDLGVYLGVNDAEAMKRLTPRFEVQPLEGNGDATE